MSKSESHTHTNALIHESSPYLLQHAHNPVDWHPWGEEAFEKAKTENKLVLISIGYSACHWCHVMEHQSFEDSTVADIMNRNFINIKVDREERPDVDQVYMNAVQLMTGSGGWPLNCFTLPDGRPIYGGTYFPQNDWVNILASLQRMKEEEPQKMEEYATNLTSGIQNSELISRNNSKDLAFTKDSIQAVVTEWKSYWDTERGGPNRAPKFPLPNNYQFLLEYAHLFEDSETLDYVYTTLDHLAQGGIYDQIGGGFSRYSTDTKWKVPHFEKMLYDNAQLVSLYSQAYTKSKNSEYKVIVDETLAFIKRELTNENGGFYSALDADSEGEEGKFYVWKKEELENELTTDEFKLVSEYYNINSKGLWEHGNYILLRHDKSDKAFEQLPNFNEKLSTIKHKLLTKRAERIRPGLDDKILTSWNAQMITGYVDAYLAFQTEDYLSIAERQMEFLLKKLQKEDGSLYHTHKNGKSTINGYLEDYSLTIQALIKLYTCKFDEKWLAEAKALTNYSLAHFYDDDSGMFWFTSDLDVPLVAKKQEITDNVLPASNSIMAENLFLLGNYYYNEHFNKVNEQMLQNIAPYIDYGQSYSNWLRLALYKTHPFYEVALTGPGFLSLKDELVQDYIPNKMLMGGKESSDLPLLEGKFFEIGTIFVCENKTCQLPVNTASAAVDQMKE